MFEYTDPVRDGVLQNLGALNNYRILVHDIDREFALLDGSSYVERDAFLELSGNANPTTDTVSWLAFPRTAVATNDEIDADRFGLQDEYVEWRVVRGPGNRIESITFTTEFTEYYMALAQQGKDPLVQAIRQVIPGANPTTQELFGPNFNPGIAGPRSRGERFRRNAQSNPWNNGQKGILFLAQRFNTMNALFNLAGECAKRRPDLDPGSVCGQVGGACGPDRNSDPRVCQACQNLARAERGLSMEDPVGIRILQLGGAWELNGQAIDINDPATNQNIWAVTRNGRRGMIRVVQGLTLDGDAVVSGAQVAAVLTVGADVISVTEDALPEWAKTGREGTRM